MKYSLYFLLILFSCDQVTDVPDPQLTYIWSGAPTTSSIVIKFKTPGEQEARVFIHGSENLKDTLASSDWIETTKNSYFTGGVVFDSLQADKTYYYSLETKGVFSDLKGKFKTLPDGPASFTIAFASCARTGSSSSVFEMINRMDPLFYMNIGDLHYENINQDCSYKFAEAYFDVLSSRTQSKLYRSRPFVYIWDDHDFGPNNSASDAECRNDALESYRMFTPHYPLPLKGKNAPISQSFIVGRVKFVLTDLRSHKERPEYKGCERVKEGSNFGSKDHLRWFKEELLSARDSGQLVAWVNTIPWVKDVNSFDYKCNETDTWAGFPEERREIANFIKENNIQLFILSGDAHMLAIDDGSNSDFATGGGAPIPVFHAAPLDNVGIVKGGPYSHGYSRKRGQFGIVEVQDDGGREICISFKGMTAEGRIATNQNGRLLSYNFCHKINFLTKRRKALK